MADFPQPPGGADARDTDPPLPSHPSSAFHGRRPLLWSVGLLGVLVLLLWLVGTDVFWIAFVVGYFGLPVCGLLWWLRLMTSEATRRHARAFLWGLPLGGFLVVGELLLEVGGSARFEATHLAFLLVFCTLPLGNLLAAGALIVGKATRWFGLGLIGGCLCLLIADGLLLAFWLSL